jgi:hypothetical protein
VHRCELCERWLCEKHLEPKLVFIRDPDAIDKIPEIRALYYSEIRGKEGNGHPDFEYSRRKLIELKMGEKRLNELIKQALDRMNHYYDEVETPEKPVDTEADRKKRVEILLREEKEIKETPSSQMFSGRVYAPNGVETATTRNNFVVPREVYENATYREYLDNADNLKSVKVIVDEYYRKYHKKRHWW